MRKSYLWGILSLVVLIGVLSGCFMFLPAAPSNLRAVAIDQISVKLSWNGSGEFVIYKRAYAGASNKDFEEIARTGSTSYTDTGLQPNTTYLYEVKTKNKFGMSDPSDVKVTTLPYPPQPPVLKVTSTSTSTVSFSWTDPSTIVRGFKLFRAENSEGPFTRAATPNDDLRSYTDSNLSPDTVYFYKMKAFNEAGESNFSTPVTAKTEEFIPSAPYDLEIVSVTTGSVTLRWETNSTSHKGFKVHRSTKNSGDYAVVANVADLTSYTDKNLEDNTAYYYEITAYNDHGESPSSNVASATTKLSVPFNPSMLKATQISTGTVSLSWKDNSDNEDGFAVYRSEGSTNFGRIATVSPNATGYADTDLDSDTLYLYEITAYNAAGESMISNVVPATTAMWIPTVPKALEVTECSTDSVDLRWENTYRATTIVWRETASKDSYATYEDNGKIMARKTSSQTAGFTPAATLTYPANTYTDSGLEYATTYLYKLQSINGLGTSDFGTILSVTTKNVVPKAPALSVKATTLTTATLQWKDNSNNEEKFRIWWRDSPNRAYTLIATVPKNVTVYKDNMKGVSNWYIVSAYNSEGESWGNPVEVDAFETIFNTCVSPDDLTLWSMDGYWHVQDNSADIYNGAVTEYGIVTLPPDDLSGGRIPYAHSGDYTFWYGQESHGNYIGSYSDTTAPGGISVSSNSGSLISPEMDLTDVDYPVLGFYSWYEIESSEPVSYDTMRVYAVTDDPSTTLLLTLNPYFSGGPDDEPYTDTGFDAAAKWKLVQIPLGAYAGKKVRILFSFDTGDYLYNGFRGWFLDDVKVLNSPNFKEDAYGLSNSVNLRNTQNGTRKKSDR